MHAVHSSKENNIAAKNSLKLDYVSLCSEIVALLQS